MSELLSCDAPVLAVEFGALLAVPVVEPPAVLLVVSGVEVDVVEDVPVEGSALDGEGEVVLPVAPTLELTEPDGGADAALF